MNETRIFFLKNEELESRFLFLFHSENGETELSHIIT